MEITMLCKKRGFRGVHVVAVLFCITVLQAQDPGPRPTGREALKGVQDANAVCAIASAKFPLTTCLDFVQPPSVSPAPPADGAGQLIGARQNPPVSAGNLVGVWFQGLTVFSTEASVDGTDDNGVAGQEILGLGPSFNAASCFQCHSQPAVGGSSPGCVNNNAFCSNMAADPNTGRVLATFTSGNNPQIVEASDRGGTNVIPAFVQARANTGPLLEARFPDGLGSGPSTLGNPASVPSGAVAELYTINGRTDTKKVAPNCQISQEPFASVSNIVFRIPIPTFGDGLVENIPEPTLNAVGGLNGAAFNEATTACPNTRCGIGFGEFNTNGNDQTISRFGWKAQNKSLFLFAGEASNVEMGVTNEIFPTERTYGNGSCTTNQLPEDVTVVLNSGTPGAGLTSQTVEDIENDAVFMRLNGAPSICNWNSTVDSTGLAVCNPADASTVHGAALFGNSIFAAAGTAPNPGIGCVLCHWQTFTTGPSTTPALSNVTFHPFSDFALHHMGGLDDGVFQGIAVTDQFRTAPLWGLGQRLFFLHDGRASDLVTAITDHCLPPSSADNPPSEACTAVSNFNALSASDKLDLLHFLRSL
jgi:CxxC motif-containing protein (DUF1111 family)